MNENNDAVTATQKQQYFAFPFIEFRHGKFIFTISFGLIVVAV